MSKEVEPTKKDDAEALVALLNIRVNDLNAYVLDAEDFSTSFTVYLYEKSGPYMGKLVVTIVELLNLVRLLAKPNSIFKMGDPQYNDMYDKVFDFLLKDIASRSGG